LFSIICFDANLYEFVVVPSSFPLKFISILELEIYRVSKYSNMILMCLFEMKDFDNE